MGKTGGADSEAGGDAGRGEGRNGGGSGSSSERGGGGDSERGYGGYGGLGIGNPGSYGGKNDPSKTGGAATDSRGGGHGPITNSVNDSRAHFGLGPVGTPSEAQGALDKYSSDRSAWNGIKYGTMVVGALLGVPTLPATALGTAAVNYGRTEAELTDMERAARANGMGDVQRGDGGDKAVEFSDGMSGNYHLPKDAYDTLVEMAKNDKATNDFLQSLNGAKSKGLVGSELIEHHNKNVGKMNDHSRATFGENKYTKQLEAVSSQINPAPKQYALKHSEAQQALDEIDEAKRQGANIAIY